MDDQNVPCIILQYNSEDILIGMGKTTSYNFWEKEEFIKMNEQTLFPCEGNGITFDNLDEWENKTDCIQISEEVNFRLNINPNIPKVFYPGY